MITTHTSIPVLCAIVSLLGGEQRAACSTENLPAPNGARKTYPRNFWNDLNLPKTFDARRKWSNCPSIGHISDQGNCKSSYAIAVASAISDRICIHSNGKEKPKISAQQIITCCYLCGEGCKGGNHFESWDFYRRHGMVSGGDYDSDEGCQPYTIEPCEHSSSVIENSCSNKTLYTPECKFECNNAGYGVRYAEDHHRGSYYRVPGYMAMKEIYEKGPITASFHAYQDFVVYQSGIYTYDPLKSGRYITTQVVKIIGWGEYDGTPYWLAANSYNTYWGENGFFKIFRGGNECYIEEAMYAGLPL